MYNFTVIRRTIQLYSAQVFASAVNDDRYADKFIHFSLLVDSGVSVHPVSGIALLPTNIIIFYTCPLHYKYKIRAHDWFCTFSCSLQKSFVSLDRFAIQRATRDCNVCTMTVARQWIFVLTIRWLNSDCCSKLSGPCTMVYIEFRKTLTVLLRFTNLYSNT